jgi:hypothetical protein
VLLSLGALAIMLACSLVAVTRSRASFFALAVGGWIAAALAVVCTPLATAGVRMPLANGTASLARRAPRLAAYAPGYYICLGAAAVIALAGIYGAVDAPESSEPPPARGVSPRHE